MRWLHNHLTISLADAVMMAYPLLKRCLAAR